MGFCYGGPYAILGPKRLGYAAGISCHGTQMLDYIGELDGVTQPVCIVWGDKDHVAPQPVLDAYRGGRVAHEERRAEIFPGVLHGYMMPSHPKPSTDSFGRRASRVKVAGCGAAQTVGGELHAPQRIQAGPPVLERVAPAPGRGPAGTGPLSVRPSGGAECRRHREEPGPDVGVADRAGDRGEAVEGLRCRFVQPYPVSSAAVWRCTYSCR